MQTRKRSLSDVNSSLRGLARILASIPSRSYGATRITEYQAERLARTGLIEIVSTDAGHGPLSADNDVWCEASAVVRRAF